MKISKFALDRPVSTTMAILSVIVMGLLSLNRIPLTFLPDINRPYLRVQTNYQGSNPEEIERLITRPIEEVMGTTPGLRSIGSNSSSGGSSVRLEFEQGTDMDMASMEVRERIDRVSSQLPDDIRDPPRIYRFQTTDWPILSLGVIWTGEPDRFENIVENVLEKRLATVEGVANVDIGGLMKKGIYIDLDQNQLRSSRINSYALTNRISSENQNLPAGYVYAGGRKYNLRVVGQYQSVDDIAGIPLNNRGLRLEQVADVRFDFPEEIRWFSRLNGHNAVSFRIYKASNANIIDVSSRAKKLLEQIKADPRFSQLDYQVYWDQSTEITKSIDSLKRAGYIGGVLAVLVLLFFLGNLRNTLVIAIAIPVSVVTTLFFIYLMRMEPIGSDLTLNIISMMGMIYAIGIVIDPSIVVLENIFRIRNEEGKSAVQAAIEGSSEVGLPILASVLTNVIVFVPLIFLGGGRGGMRFMRDFGLTFCVVCLASFVVAVTVVPLLTGRLIHNLEPGKERSFPRMRKVFAYLVDRALRYRLLTMFIVAFIMWGAFQLNKMIDKESSGWAPDRRLNVSMNISHNYSMADASKIVTELEQDLLAHKDELEIKSVTSSINMGRRNRGELGIFFTEADKESRSTQELLALIKGRVPEIPGFEFHYNRWHGRSGGGGVGINLRGQSLEMLTTYAERIRDLMKDIPGVQDVKLSTEQGEQEIRVMVKRDRAMANGISAENVARTISSQLSSRAVSRFKAPEREIDIDVGLRREDRLNLRGLQTMQVYGDAGGRTTLDNIAAIKLGVGPRSIEKDDRMFNVEINLEAEGSGIFQLSNEVMARMRQISLAPGYSWELGRNYQNMVEEESQSRFAIVLALVLIYILLAALFESFIHPFTILLSVPFAIIGVALIFVATGTNLGTVAYIGVIIVCGLVVNNGIILVDCITLLRSRGLTRRDAIMEAVQKRMRPIMMTAATTILSLLPMVAPLLVPALFGPSEGRAANWGPVGLAILGGMTTSTFLTLVITPTLYSLFDDLAAAAKRLAGRVFQSKRLIRS